MKNQWREDTASVPGQLPAYVPPSGIFLDALNQFVTGTRQIISNLHRRGPECDTLGCVIHNPTDPHQNWPTHFRENGLMERLCPCGVGHPDKDSLAWFTRMGRDYMGVHGCCGCCDV